MCCERLFLCELSQSHSGGRKETNHWLLKENTHMNTHSQRWRKVITVTTVCSSCPVMMNKMITPSHGHWRTCHPPNVPFLMKRKRWKPKTLFKSGYKKQIPNTVGMKDRKQRKYPQMQQMFRKHTVFSPLEEFSLCIWGRTSKSRNASSHSGDVPLVTATERLLFLHSISSVNVEATFCEQFQFNVGKTPQGPTHKTQVGNQGHVSCPFLLTPWVQDHGRISGHRSFVFLSLVL